MSLNSFKISIKDLQDSLFNVAYHKADLAKKPKRSITFSFKKNREEVYKNAVVRNMKIIKTKVWDLAILGTIAENREKIISLLNLIKDLENAYKINDMKEMLIILEETKKLTNSLKDMPKLPTLDFEVPKLHEDIKEEIMADVKELKKCYDSKCYRSVIIICGRIMEAALHRKYYEVTNVDFLEKAPGIGLGKMIAKLSEKNVKMDPGLTQQIHLINQVRVFSVHKKQEPFYPTKEQAHAIILFTLDSLKKLF